MLKIIGICILIFTICYISKTLSDKRRRALSVYEELSRFLHFVKRSIGCYLMPLRDIAVGFDSELLDSYGFLALIRDGACGIDALEKSGLCGVLDAESSRLLSTFFSSFGSGYLDEELRLVSSVLEELDEKVAFERRRTPERVRLFGTLGAAASLALLILIL